MRSVFALVLLLAATGSAPLYQAIPQATEPAPRTKGSRIYTELPPPTYYGDTWIEVRFSSDVHEACLPYAPWWPADRRIGACTIHEVASGAVLFMILPNPCRLFEYDGFYRPGGFAKTTCHEIGHVNGWPGTHED